MVTVRPAQKEDVEGICRVCRDGWRDTSADLLPTAYVEDVIAEFYMPERVRQELAPTTGWDGWLVADDEGIVVGAAGGGMISTTEGELFVLYLDPSRRREGIGTALLDAITSQQRAHGATGQWVSVLKNNGKGLPFYYARGFTYQHDRDEQYGESAQAYADDPSIAAVRLWRPLA